MSTPEPKAHAPYAASGRDAQRRLTARACQCGHRNLERLRAFKHCINTLCAAGIVTIPAIGAITQSAEAAAFTAGMFMLFATVLEVLERRVKRQLARGV